MKIVLPIRLYQNYFIVCFTQPKKKTKNKRGDF